MNKVYEEKGEIIIPDDCYKLPVHNKRGVNLQINLPTFNAKWLDGSEMIFAKNPNGPGRQLLSKYQDWTKEEVAFWLENTLKLQKYVQTFLDNDIDGATLDYIGDDDLEDFGIKLNVHRKKILGEIQKLKENQ